MNPAAVSDAGSSSMCMPSLVDDAVACTAGMWTELPDSAPISVANVGGSLSGVLSVARKQGARSDAGNQASEERGSGPHAAAATGDETVRAAISTKKDASPHLTKNRDGRTSSTDRVSDLSLIHI